MSISRKAAFAPLAVAALLLAMLVAAPQARADQVAITSGFYDTTSPFRHTEPRYISVAFNLQGTNFRASGGEADGINRSVGSNCQFPCTAGSTFSLSPTASLFIEKPTSLLAIDGQNRFGWFTGTELLFQTEGVTIPLNAGPELTLSARFTMSGTVSFVEYDLQKLTFTGFKYETEVFGTGVANILLFYNQSSQSYSVLSVRYNFTPVPEPATMLLLGTGLAGVAARRRSQRRRARGGEAAGSC